MNGFDSDPELPDEQPPLPLLPASFSILLPINLSKASVANSPAIGNVSATIATKKLALIPSTPKLFVTAAKSGVTPIPATKSSTGETALRAVQDNRQVDRIAKGGHFYAEQKVFKMTCWRGLSEPNSEQQYTLHYIWRRCRRATAARMGRT